MRATSPGPRAKHYTDRDIEQLRAVYRGAYPFIGLTLDEPVQLETQDSNYNRRLSDIQARLDRQRVLEAKLTVLEDEIEQIKQFRKWVEQRDAR